MLAFLPITLRRYMISASRYADCHVHLDRTDHLNVAWVCTWARVTGCQISAAAAAHLENILKLLLGFCHRAETAPGSQPSQQSTCVGSMQTVDLPSLWEAKLTCKATPKACWWRKSFPLCQEERSAGCRGDQLSPEDWGIWGMGLSSVSQGRAWQYKRKSKPRGLMWRKQPKETVTGEQPHLFPDSVSAKSC